ncbi:hypothetical protein IFT79_03775 [Frigoribacterium sp. CFBP 8759]|uniref:hypothetical protein n=1 Tax=unclassified Frigoribacterium TaxID=2627005 RepID=UPI00177DDA78|nr:MULTISPECIES: hypothetical protein [unclassified Frigoribacterium]MBD8139645.1 hypothetical protein [Frigoribacterium sp. CFBP 13605]MBD8484729.1 hypothetical protein [Frigoribacterium sp. CFBP 8759]
MSETDTDATTDFDILIGHDPETWVALPTSWPHDGHRAPRSWIKATVRTVAERSEVSTRASRSWLTEVLSALARWSPEDERRYLYLPDIATPPSLLRVQYGFVGGDRDVALRAMVFDSDVAAVEPPVVEQVEASGLGQGLRGVRYAAVDGDAGLHATLVYAFRAEPYDLRVTCQVGGPEGVLGMIDEVDVFVDDISVVPAA